MWPPFCSAAFRESSLLMNSKSWKNLQRVSNDLFCIVKRCGLINTPGCVIIHYSVLQLVNTWHGEGEMAVCFPSVLMLISNKHQRAHQFHRFRGDKNVKQKIIYVILRDRYLNVNFTGYGLHAFS